MLILEAKIKVIPHNNLPITVTEREKKIWKLV